jgi:membrane-associated phospholipid phosphatase
MDRRAQSGWNLACLGISSLVFIATLAAVLVGASDGLDAAVRTLVNGWATPELTRLFTLVTDLGSVAVVFSLTAVAAVALALLARRRDALRLLAVMGAAVVVNNGLKYAVARARPEAFFGELPASYSFASGHALYAGCFYGVVGALIAATLPQAWQRTAVLAATLTLIGAIGFSRIYLGVHYPTDVLAGFALAALIVCLVRGLFAARGAPGA